MVLWLSSSSCVRCFKRWISEGNTSYTTREMSKFSQGLRPWTPLTHFVSPAATKKKRKKRYFTLLSKKRLLSKFSIFRRAGPAGNANHKINCGCPQVKWYTLRGIVCLSITSAVKASDRIPLLKDHRGAENFRLRRTISCHIIITCVITIVSNSTVSNS